MTATVWTLRRKWLGNGIPALFWLPPIILGMKWMLDNGKVIGAGLWLLILGTVLGWLAVNYFGLFENKRMRRQLFTILEARKESLRDAPFVGVATPKYSSALDPHEDVGFLRLFPDRLSFVSETRHIEMPIEDVRQVRFRPNVHSAIGLGRWISVEGEVDGKPVRLLIEPRERPTLLGNRIYSKSLAQRIRRWIASK